MEESAHRKAVLVLKLQGQQTIEQIEKWLAELDHGNAREITVNTDLHSSELGGVGSLIQLLISWSKRYPDGTLLLHTNKPERAAIHLQNLSGFHHGLLALLLASDVRTADKAESVRPVARLWAKRRVEEMIDETTLSPDILLLSADQTTKKFIPQFYYPRPDPYGLLRSDSHFISLSLTLILKLSQRRSANIVPDEKLIDNLGTLIYELFKNTHQWARTDITGNPIRRSVRG